MNEYNNIEKEIFKESSIKLCGRTFDQVKNKTLSWNSTFSMTLITTKVVFFGLKDRL